MGFSTLLEAQIVKYHSPFRNLADLSRPICQITVPPFSTTSPVVLIADLEAVKDIAVRRIQEFDRASLIHNWFSTIFPRASTSMTSTPAFRQQRRIWNCMLNPDFLDNVATLVFQSTIHQYIKLWTMKSELANDSFVAYEDIRRLSLEGIWKILLGCDLGLAEASISLCLQKKTTKTGKALSRHFPHFYGDFMTQIIALLWVVTGISSSMYKFLLKILPPFQNAVTRTHDTMNSLIGDARNKINSGLPTTRCGLSEILQLPEIPADDVLVDEIVELLMTGHETSATTMAWGFKLLADNQEVQDRLHTALKATWPDTGLPNALQISQANIPYLDATLAEILRLAATAPVAFRETTTECEVLGHRLPAKTPVFLVTQSAPSKYGMIAPNSFNVDSKANNTDFCSSFERFIPERWLDIERTFNPDAGLSLPFSAGKRGCFGKRIAMLELKLTVTMFVLSFHFEKLPKNWSKYNVHDTLTRQPACCYIKPVVR
jgi:cytochrome P450